MTRCVTVTGWGLALVWQDLRRERVSQGFVIMVKRLIKMAMRKAKRKRQVQKKKEARLLQRPMGKKIVSAEQVGLSVCLVSVCVRARVGGWVRARACVQTGRCVIFPVLCFLSTTRHDSGAYVCACAVSSHLGSPSLVLCRNSGRCVAGQSVRGQLEGHAR